MFENRTYRKHHKKPGLVSFDITVKETNLNIQARSDLTRKAIESVVKYRALIESYIQLHPEFARSLAPLPEPEFAPGIILEMIQAARLAHVGPMAAVAGALAEYTGKALLAHTPEVIVENGGDIFVKSDTETLFSIYAGNSGMAPGILISRRARSFAVCTSSGTLGHSLSLGKADAVTVLSDSGALADAMATALGNRVHKASDIEKAIHFGKNTEGIQGIVIIKGTRMGLWGDLKLVPLPSPGP